jgi:hypothetical protein
MAQGTKRLSNAEGRELLRQMASGGKGKGLLTPAPKGGRLGDGTSLAVQQAEKEQKKHKFNAIMVEDEVTGRKATKLEDAHAREYRAMLKAGVIAVYAPQAEIGLHSPRTGGYHVYRCDHLLIYNDGRREFIDSKGVETPEYKKKANWMERQFLPANPGATFIARFKDHTHTYVAKPKKGKK